MKKLNSTKQSGFIQLIALIIVLLVVAYFFGFKPNEIWSNIFVPIITFVWGVIVVFVEFLVDLLRKAWETLQGFSFISDLTKKYF